MKPRLSNLWTMWLCNDCKKVFALEKNTEASVCPLCGRNNVSESQIGFAVPVEEITKHLGSNDALRRIMN